MPRPYPAPSTRHVGPVSWPVFWGATLLAIVLALLLPASANAGDREGYGRQAYYYDEDARYTGGSLGYYPNLDDSYHAQYDRTYSTRRHHGYSRSYERDYNGRDYNCNCRRGSYHRVYNWKGEHEYRQSSHRNTRYSYRDAYRDY